MSLTFHNFSCSLACLSTMLYRLKQCINDSICQPLLLLIFLIHFLLFWVLSALFSYLYIFIFYWCAALEFPQNVAFLTFILFTWVLSQGTGVFTFRTFIQISRLSLAHNIQMGTSLRKPGETINTWSLEWGR